MAVVTEPAYQAHQRAIENRAREFLEESASPKFSPSDDRLVVMMDPLDKTTETGNVLLPDRIADWTAYGTVIAVGPGARNDRGERIPLDVKVGDRVVFDWRPSHEEMAMQKYFGRGAILLKQDEIAGIVEPD